MALEVELQGETEQRRRARPAMVLRLAGAEAAFQERELLYRDLLNALPAAVYMTDPDGRITFYNEAAVALSGRRPALGDDQWCVTWRLFYPDGAPMPHDECPMALALKEGRELRGVEAIAERPDGSRVAFIPFPTLLRDAAGAVVGAVNMLVDITDRKAAEQRQTLLAHEVDHRANNLLAVVHATLRLTDAPTVAAFKHALEGRIRALGHAHALLAKSRWAGVQLQALVSEELAAYVGQESPRVWMSGQVLPLDPRAAQSVAMVIHELASNAGEHGALSGDKGRVLIEWRETEDNRLIFRWTELDGPVPVPPTRRGVGTTVIERSVSHLHGEAKCDWAETGLVFEMTLPRGALLAKATVG